MRAAVCREEGFSDKRFKQRIGVFDLEVGLGSFG